MTRNAQVPGKPACQYPGFHCPFSAGFLPLDLRDIPYFLRAIGFGGIVMTDDMQQAPAPSPQVDAGAPVFMVEFKGSRKEYYRNPYALNLSPGNWVIVQVERGEDLGQIVTQVDPTQINPEQVKPLPVLRLASPEEINVKAQNAQKEKDARGECITLIAKRGLHMKLVDVEWQFDGNKVTFYFTAEKRVDFRELVKDLAAVYRTRIELRQIGARDEARRVGGFGVCGLEQCCTSFLHEFEPITTQLAREQNLSLNPAKISGNCGRLLCCLRYESEFYREAVKAYPRPGSKYVTEKGEGKVERVVILQQQMIVRHEGGEEEKISLLDLRRAMRKRSWMKD
jgi:cell fate regulator YaaT (PSP1 superfamily)